MFLHVNDLLLNICTLLNIMRVQLPTVNASNVESFANDRVVFLCEYNDGRCD